MLTICSFLSELRSKPPTIAIRDVQKSISTSEVAPSSVEGQISMMLLYRPTLPVYSPKGLTVSDSVAFRCAHRDTAKGY